LIDKFRAFERSGKSVLKVIINSYILMNKTKGFTLIELLVVIAIIGILSSVVLASLSTARNKGADAAIKSGLNNMRAQAELYYDNNSSSYGTLASTSDASCTGASASVIADPTIKAALTSAFTQSGAMACGAGPGYYTIAARLKSDATLGYCISSSGVAKQITWNATPANNVAAGVCN
jgi:prepilin-type N-terminal cleavage/methylation domain-containing protein